MKSLYPVYDVVVVGGGHAGCEAAAISAKMGATVLLITMNLETLGKMSCNPSMGGIAKGQIVREIDALGGICGILSDKAGIQFRMLNTSKGPAMWSPRCQVDRHLYSQLMRRYLEKIPNLHFRQDNVIDIRVDANKISGIITYSGQYIRCKTLILTTGTFLRGKIYIGNKSYSGGRSGEEASSGISKTLLDLGFQLDRLRTGTPPRLDGRSINFDELEIQYGDSNPTPFSFMTTTLPNQKEQLCCWKSQTDEKIHQLIRNSFDRAPIFNGTIKAEGPRYCPSIELKILRFAEKKSHPLYIEPEGINTSEMYLNGFSTSLPEEIQYNVLKKLPGFHNVNILRPGYAIEYDYIKPSYIYPSLETKIVKGLFFAGQINGTTGYEEAACQGLIAGINATKNAKKEDYLILKRSEAYIGVLINDLTTMNISEPYRMFTSRAENRIFLRHSNADYRLTPKGKELKTITQERWDIFQQKMDELKRLGQFIKEYKIKPSIINRLLDASQKKILYAMSISQFLMRQNINISILMGNIPDIKREIMSITDNITVINEAEIQVKYAHYEEKERLLYSIVRENENINIPTNLEYDKIHSLSIEGREKLIYFKPSTIASAQKISGISQSDISVLLIYLKNIGHKINWTK